MPKSQNFGVREASQRHPFLCNSLLKCIFIVTNKHTTAEEVLEPVFSTQSLTGLYKERGLKNAVSGPVGPMTILFGPKNTAMGPKTKNACAGDGQQQFT
jgi:hypothetical protein